jgi:3-deoxy-manno-octulosonate cytidylyltransferase (CMP-KDO synthetase)
MADEPGGASGPNYCIIIPARFDSTRYPGKPLVRLRGAGGVERSLVEWTWRTARASAGSAPVMVATDDRRIADEVERFGGQVVMTPADCANGTERCAAALQELSDPAEIVVNLQGDAPLTPPTIIDRLVAAMREDPELPVATPALRATPETHRLLMDDQRAGRVGGTTLVFNAAGDALYFSKCVLPHTGSVTGDTPVHLHLGVYAYRRAALERYVAAPPSVLELAEGLEQLRFLHLGVRVGAVVCDPPAGLMIELNNPSDKPLVEGELARRGEGSQ